MLCFFIFNGSEMIKKFIKICGITSNVFNIEDQHLHPRNLIVDNELGQEYIFSMSKTIFLKFLHQARDKWCNFGNYVNSFYKIISKVIYDNDDKILLFVDWLLMD